MPDVEEPLVTKDKKDEDAKEDEEPAKSAFWTKFSLALSMASWVSLFYIPVVFPSVHHWFFGTMDLEDVLGSPNLVGYWPNVVQLIVFTVYFSTGSTMNLAWQGIIGTASAGVNLFVMGKLFPLGGKCLKVVPTTSGMRGFCEEYADPNYGRFEWFVWLDVFAFLFLILSSNAKENTMKFGISWHAFYMMGFMSFAGYTPSHAVNYTTIVGASMAVLITMVPSWKNGRIFFKNVVANNLAGHPIRIANKVTQVSQGTVKFVLADKPTTHEERYNFKVRKVAILNNVRGLAPMADIMSSDWSTSWWEGWVYGLFGGLKKVTEHHRIRTHCGIFAKAFQDDIGGFDDVAFFMQKVVSATDQSDYRFMLNTDLEAIHEERKELRGPVEQLNNASMELLRYISDWKNWSATEKLDDYVQSVKGMKQDVQHKFIALWAAYNTWMANNPVAGKSKTRQILRDNMSVFIFSILQLSEEVMDLSDKIIDKYTETASKTPCEDMISGCRSIWQEFKDTWMSSQGRLTFFDVFTNPDKRSFTFRNVVSIGLAFILGNMLEGNVFTSPFSANMAGTLGVLISRFPGSAFYKNLMRLLGLSIGNALPIIMMALVSMSGDVIQPFVHLFAFFVFELYFGLMYFSSPEWSYVGCIVAGFGCYSFTSSSWDNSLFISRYCNIGQVTAAITIQIVTDMVDTAWRKKFPRDIVMENMKQMLDSMEDVFKSFKTCLSTPSAPVIKDIKTKVLGLKKLMASQEQMVSECAPKTTMVAGPSPPFKLDMYKSALSIISDLLGEIDALCLIDEFDEKIAETAGKERKGWFDDDYMPLCDEVLNAMGRTFRTLLLIMSKNDESLVPKDEAMLSLVSSQMTHAHEDGVRMAVVKRIFSDTLTHVLGIEHLCCSSECLALSDE